MADKVESDTRDSWASADVSVPHDIAAAARARAAAPAQTRTGQPAWVGKFVWSALWKFVAVGISVFLLATMVWRAQTLIRMLALSVFFALAMIPAVKYMHERWGWRRGAAVGAVYAGFLIFIILLVGLMIPAVVDFAENVQGQGGEWADQINGYSQDLIGEDVIDLESGVAAGETAGAGISEFTDNIAGAAMSGISLIFNLMTVLLFTFYFAADAPRIERALLSRMQPDNQKVAGWVWDTAVEQTGGYFYFADVVDGHQRRVVLRRDDPGRDACALRHSLGDLRRLCRRVHPRDRDVSRCGSSDPAGLGRTGSRPGVDPFGVGSDLSAG